MVQLLHTTFYISFMLSSLPFLHTLAFFPTYRGTFTYKNITGTFNAASSVEKSATSPHIWCLY